MKDGFPNNLSERNENKRKLTGVYPVVNGKKQEGAPVLSKDDFKKEWSSIQQKLAALERESKKIRKLEGKCLREIIKEFGAFLPTQEIDGKKMVQILRKRYVQNMNYSQNVVEIPFYEEIFYADRAGNLYKKGVSLGEEQKLKIGIYTEPTLATITYDDFLKENSLQDVLAYLNDQLAYSKKIVEKIEDELRNRRNYLRELLDTDDENSQL